MESRETMLLRQLAEHFGVLSGYHDIWGEQHPTSDRTRRAILAAMGLPVADEAALETELNRPSDPADAAPPELLDDAPSRAYCPDPILRGQRRWGINLALYGVRSRRNWGIGDFADLLVAAGWAADLGAEFLGLLPLHALFNTPPHSVSPYFPSSRLFLNPIYIAVESVPESAAGPVQTVVGSAPCQRRLAALRAAPLVDYAGVWALKREVLETAFAVFQRREPQPRNTEFCRWRGAQGLPLEQFATFCALRDHLTSADGAPVPWRRWPQQYQHPDGAAVATFASQHPDQVAFHAWLQWLAETQLAAVQQHCRERGMGIGLYLDTALGVDPGGADAWVFQNVLAVSASAGAPPDPFSLLGQRWGVPPTIPSRHRATGYRFLRLSLAHNAARAGALRLDHVLAFWRLFWVPDGLTAADGAYVRENSEELLALARRVSHDHRCLIVGEDLGTVPPEVHAELTASGLFSYRVLIFEKDPHGFFHLPEAYPSQALVAVTTHDLPPLDGFWLGRDLELKRKLQRYPDEAAWNHDLEVRRWDRFRLQERLRDQGLLPDGMEPTFEVCPEHLEDLAVAVHAYLARTPAALLQVNADDLLGERDMQNLPGTLEEHPNWQRKGTILLENWPQLARAQRVAEALHREGRSRPPGER